MDRAVSNEGNVQFRDEHPDLGDGRDEILAGLLRPQKKIDPKWFYDQHGSELFDEITRLPEYYPTRTEVAILKSQRESIANHCGEDCLLIEPGSGSSEKVRILLDSLRPSLYVPVDISADFLQQSAGDLGAEYPWLNVYAVCADFNAGWEFLDDLPAGKRVIFYPGSTLGNLEPQRARQFLRGVAAVVGSDGGVLIGVDTHKPTPLLHAAYNDSAGVTEAFNLNVLTRLNDLLDADFDLAAFEHHAFYNEELRRIEMHLISSRNQSVYCAGEVLAFSKGETIHTECSYKYSPADFADLVAAAGLEIAETWQDADEMFGVHYLRRAA
jgi:dimethylhistidine N-methyltransferase